MKGWTGKRAAVFALAGMLAAGGAAAPAVTVDAAKSSLEKSAEKLVKKYGMCAIRTWINSERKVQGNIS